MASLLGSLTLPFGKGRGLTREAPPCFQVTGKLNGHVQLKPIASWGLGSRRRVATEVGANRTPPAMSANR